MSKSVIQRRQNKPVTGGNTAVNSGSGGRRERRIMYDSTGPNDSRYYVGRSFLLLGRISFIIFYE